MYELQLGLVVVCFTLSFISLLEPTNQRTHLQGPQAGKCFDWSEVFQEGEHPPRHRLRPRQALHWLGDKVSGNQFCTHLLYCAVLTLVWNRLIYFRQHIEYAEKKAVTGQNYRLGTWCLTIIYFQRNHSLYVSQCTFRSGTKSKRWSGVTRLMLIIWHDDDDLMMML